MVQVDLYTQRYQVVSSSARVGANYVDMQTHMNEGDEILGVGDLPFDELPELEHPLVHLAHRLTVRRRPSDMSDLRLHHCRRLLLEGQSVERVHKRLGALLLGRVPERERARRRE